MAASTRARSGPRSGFAVLIVVGLAAIGLGLVWSIYVARQIAEVAAEDQATTADAIAVFGAAEYGGRPSPILHLRLDHALELYRQHLAPVIITLGGGADRDSGKSEGGVGRDYLLAQGVPLADILAETQSTNTVQQVHRLAAIARDHNLRQVIVVSDATHLFRIRELCEQAGLEVYTSPRAPQGHLSDYSLARRYVHEIASYTALKFGLEEGELHRLLGMDSGADD